MNDATEALGYRVSLETRRPDSKSATKRFVGITLNTKTGKVVIYIDVPDEMSEEESLSPNTLWLLCGKPLLDGFFQE